MTTTEIIAEINKAASLLFGSSAFSATSMDAREDAQNIRRAAFMLGTLKGRLEASHPPAGGDVPESGAGQTGSEAT